MSLYTLFKQKKWVYICIPVYSSSSVHAGVGGGIEWWARVRVFDFYFTDMLNGTSKLSTTQFRGCKNSCKRLIPAWLLCPPSFMSRTRPRLLVPFLHLSCVLLSMFVGYMCLCAAFSVSLPPARLLP